MHIYDVVINKGEIFDGVHSSPFKKNIAIQGDTIYRISSKKMYGREEIEADGFIVCPGFIDIHSHADIRIFSSPTEKIMQGVTSEVVGNCGFTPFPVVQGREVEVKEFAKPLLGEALRGWKWRTAGDYFDILKKVGLVNNIATLIGHGNLRVNVGETTQKEVSKAQLDRMCGLLAGSLSYPGVVGLSLGLEYAPGSYAQYEEILRLCEVLEKKNGVLAVHLRNYYNDLKDSVNEVLNLSRSTGVSLQISHLQEGNPEYRTAIHEVLELIQDARDREGLDVSIDMYPYLAGSTILTYLLPEWLLEGGKEEMLNRLINKKIRARAKEEMANWRSADWSNIIISYVPSNDESIIGKNVKDISEARKIEPEEAILDIIYEERGEGTLVKFDKNEEDLIKTFVFPYSMIGTDGIWTSGKPHPRLFGTYARFLGEYVRKKKIMDLNTAIKKCTVKTAEKFGFSNIGSIIEGNKADLLIIDYNKIRR